GAVRPPPRPASSSAMRMKTSTTARSNSAARRARGTRRHSFLARVRICTRASPRTTAGLLLLGPRLLVDQVLQLAHELGDVPELAVHGGEADVGHPVQRVQPPHR